VVKKCVFLGGLVLSPKEVVLPSTTPPYEKIKQSYTFLVYTPISYIIVAATQQVLSEKTFFLP
tara:strand:+ start:4459 stop:4647 length:189 start_codon:yes stop_codon:yes gene_type:complete